MTTESRQAQTEQSTDDPACRRRAPRIPMPVDVALIADGIQVDAVIRDASIGANGECVGVCIFHHGFLPLDRALECRVSGKCDVLPGESLVTLMWTRQFGNDGYLSGGRMMAK